MTRLLRETALAKLAVAALTLAIPRTVLSAQNPLCEPGEELRREIETASAPLAAPGSESLEQALEPLRNLRARFPRDLFVHLRYQDAIKERGVEGHLRQMVEEYLALRTGATVDAFYLYLYGRALEGRTTPTAVSMMEEVLKLDPHFAPVHRTLAEIYGSPRFRDPKKEKTERAKFQEACPGGVIPSQPPRPLSPGDLSGAKRLVGREETKERVPELVYQAFQQDQLRLQRIRPFDWYTVEQKRQVAREVQSAQWKGWGLLVKHYVKTQQEEKAQQLLSEMQGRMERIRGEQEPELFWTAASSLLDLYTARKQAKEFREVAAQMDRFLAANPNAKRAAQLARLRQSQLRSR